MPHLNFNALRDLHNSANDLLHSPTTQQALVRQGREKEWVHQLSEASLRMLDVCSISRDVLLLVKEHLQDLQFTLRRVLIIGESDLITTQISAYNCYRKKLKKDTLKCLHTLRGMKNRSPLGVASSDDPREPSTLLLVVQVLKQVRVTAISIVESLLSLVSTPWLETKPPPARGSYSFAAKLIMRSSTTTTRDHHHRHSLYDVCDEMELHSANKRMEAVETAIEVLEFELQCIFRRLIQTRVSLLNLLTD